ncbi:F-actin-monooxygenase MICAL3-like [Epinephelus moara]|uniref:F-actin-monooxygenase MICAL3-like n=1 Tax=Epinephelus moara TaxID=300413 RepID=UPI00214F2DC5|nr:F-actin-monooxygenase MICAL3-like [Epinephelus moara]
MGDETYPECRAQELFDEFVSASTCRAALWSFSQLCEHLQLDRSAAERPLYRPIKRRLNYWRANALWAKLDRRATQQEYQRARVCSNTTCVIIGAGPCGLRTAVELSFMGARVVLLEKRDSFSRNNVLHLWPFTIHDLRGLGAKKFYGKFCAGSIDHISIRQLQLVLLKVALLLGVEVHVNVEFKNLVAPPEDQYRHKVGWRMEVSPKAHPVNQLEFDVIIGADGRRNTLPGFRRKEFRGKLAIAITANFKNRNTSAEAKVEEISGVAFIFNQRFFQELRQETGIDLENIVYYKDDTHYFVMTAKKQSLLEKRVIKQDFADTELLLSRGNVDQNALQAYAREAADFSTNHQLPSLDFAMNHYGQPDVAMFDFTCMYASENAALIRQRYGHQLLVTLVGDSLLEVRQVEGQTESLYRLLPQTTPENLQRNISLFTVDPTTRYLNINLLLVTPVQVRHLVDTGEEAGLNTHSGDITRLPSPGLHPQSSLSQSNQLLSWCQEQTRGYRGVAVTDLTTSWKSGLALCALIHRFRPDLIDFDLLDVSSVEDNTRLGFDVAERQFGISPLMTVDEMASVGEPDSLSMVMYLSQFYQMLKDTPPPAGTLSQSSDLRSALITPASLLSRLGLSPSRKRNPKEQKDTVGKRRRTSRVCRDQQESCDLNRDDVSQVCDEAFVGGASGSRVRLMANQLQAKLDESSASCRSSSSCSAAAASLCRQRKRTLQQEQMSFRFREKVRSQSVVSRDEQVCGGGSSDVCFFCQRRVYLMERLSAESLFFHRSCFQCFHCGSTLRLAAYAFDQHNRRFYCLQHYDSRLNAPTAKRRSTPSDRGTSHRTSIASLCSAPSGSSADSLISAERRRSSVVSVMAATPERIELENYRRSSTKVEVELLEEPEEEPEEVSEETLNRFNLSMDEKVRHRSSSGSEMEEEEEEGSRRHCVTSEEAKASWRETLQQHLHLREENKRGRNMQGVQKSITQYGLRSQISRPAAEDTDDNMAPPQIDTAAELASIKTLLQTIASDMSGLKAGMDAVQTTVETLGHRVTEAETRISALEDKDEVRETAVNTAMRTVTQLQERVIYLEDAGRRNNVRIVGIEEGAEGRDIQGFVQKLISETLDVELTQDFEIERSHRTGQRGGRDRHILVRFLRFTAREAVLRAAREKGRATWKEEEFPPVVSSPAGSDITQCDTPVEPDSTSGPLPCVTSSTPPYETPATANTPSTASFVTTPDSTPDIDRDTAPPTQLTPVVMETAQRQPAGGRGSFDDINPEVLQTRPRLLQARGAGPGEDKEVSEEEGAGSEEVRRRRRLKGAQTLPTRLLLPPLQAGGGALLHQLKGLREAPPLGQMEVEGGGARAMWRTVFSGNRKEKQRKKRGRTLPPGAGRVKTANRRRATDVTEESDLVSSALLQRCSLTPRNNLRLELFDLTSEIQRVTIKEEDEEENQEPAYVPHALAFKRAYAIKRRSRKDRVPVQDSERRSSCSTEVVGVLVQPKEPSSLSVKETMFQRGQEDEEEDLDTKITRRVQRAARRKAKQEQLKRLHKAQMIQRQLQQVEEKQRQLEERGVMVEKALRGEADYWGDSNDNQDVELHLEGLGKLDNPALMQQWFQLVQQKNSLIRYESELMIFARELELEDRQSRLQQELRERMAVDDHLKEEWQLLEERLILEEMLEVVEQRDSLVSLLEEQRLQERQEDQDLEEVMMTRGLGLSWT